VTDQAENATSSSEDRAALLSGPVDFDIDSDLDAKTIPLRHPVQWVATAVLLVFAAMFIHSLFANPNYDWSVVRQYMFSRLIFSGVRLTIELTVIGMGISVVLGIVCAVMRLSSNRLLTGASVTYVWFFRACPLMVQLIFWYNLAALYPHLGLGIPFGPQFVTLTANNIITPFLAAIFGLSLYEGAYMAEIVRGGILAVEAGQTEAAQSLGMSRGLTLRRIVLPQAMRVIIPPTGNELIGMLKNTALVSVIALSELLYTAQSVYMRTYQEIPMLIVVILWYLIIVSVLSIGQYYLERHYGRGHQGSSTGGLVGYTTVLRRFFILRHSDAPGVGKGQS
jgi:polar amino acid transport system permease protein